MTSGDSVLSPESTVTTLLASSGRMSGSLYPKAAGTIKYKNRRYDSATEALDAYIADFQLSASDAPVGQLELLPKEPDTPHVLRSGHRSRDVLKESLSDAELELLHFPAGAPHRASDRCSITTDDLLLLPCDGSLPVTRTSAALSRPGGHPLGCCVNSTPWSRSMLGGIGKKSFHCHRGNVSTWLKAPPSGGERSLHVDDLLVGSMPSCPGAHLPMEMLPSHAAHHLPRWITSHKSEMDFSGVTSIPELSYPAWLRECHVPMVALAGAPSAPSWVTELEWNAGQQEPRGHEKGRRQRGSEQVTLQELKLQFGETLAAAESSVSVRDQQEPFQGDRIGFLIQRAEQVLNSPSLGLCGSEQPASRGAERSWDSPPIMFKSPVPVGGAKEHLTTKESQEDTMEKTTGSCSSGYSSRKHPGPVEALKQMLFSLQAVEQRVIQQEDPRMRGGHSETAPPTPTQAEHREMEEVSTAECEYESAPGGQSLKRALHHLGRLKSLVDEMNERKPGELQQGTECKDEGRSV